LFIDSLLCQKGAGIHLPAPFLWALHECVEKARLSAGTWMQNCSISLQKFIIDSWSQRWTNACRHIQRYF
jgi:hypothetical protein